MEKDWNNASGPREVTATWGRHEKNHASKRWGLELNSWLQHSDEWAKNEVIPGKRPSVTCESPSTDNIAWSTGHIKASKEGSTESDIHLELSGMLGSSRVSLQVCSWALTRKLVCPSSQEMSRTVQSDRDNGNWSTKNHWKNHCERHGNGQVVSIERYRVPGSCSLPETVFLVFLTTGCPAMKEL